MPRKRETGGRPPSGNQATFETRKENSSSDTPRIERAFLRTERLILSVPRYRRQSVRTETPRRRAKTALSCLFRKNSTRPSFSGCGNVPPPFISEMEIQSSTQPWHFSSYRRSGKSATQSDATSRPSRGAEKGGTRVNKDYMTSCWVRVSTDAEKGCSHPNSRKYRSALYAENMTEAQAARFVELCIRIAPMLSLIAQLFPKKDLKTFNPKYVSCDNGHGQ